jgi:hypothetical protein
MARHELLNNIAHQHTHVMHHFGSRYGDNLASVPVFPTEFIELQKDYPVLFRRDKEDGPYQAIALLGFADSENLFLEKNTATGWDARYIPASVERGPFLIGFQRQQDIHGEKTEPVLHIDMDHPKVTEGQGQPLFLAQGGNSPYLEYISLRLQAIHQGMELQKGMFATFEQLNLIEPINIEFELNNGQKHRLIGNYGINEERLAQLNGQQLEQLHRAGYLQLAFAVISSITNIRALIERKNRQSDNRRERA